jgi:hypothetical protein
MLIKFITSQNAGGVCLYISRILSSGAAKRGVMLIWIGNLFL